MVVTYYVKLFQTGVDKRYFIVFSPSSRRDNKQICHSFLFNIRSYSPKVINIQSRKGELSFTLLRVNSFDIKQKRHGIFVLLYATNIKQDLGR